MLPAIALLAVVVSASPDRCVFETPQVHAATAAPPEAAELSGPGPFRIVCRFHVVRRSDGTGGIDESKIEPALKDLNNGFRDTPFYFVREPGITYIDDDGYYADIPVLPQQGAITDAWYTPGVLNFFLAPSVAGGATGGAWYGPPLHSHERGIFLAYFATGEPSNIVTPIHEAGHIFKLGHPFDNGFGVECTSGINCETAGDFVCDTPSSPIVFGGPLGNTTATGIYFANEPGPCFNDPPFDPDTRNYMDAGWPAGHILRNRFTQGQLDRMILYAQFEQFDLINQAPVVLVDCDNDGLDDPEQILAGNVADINLNFVPDSCEIFPRADDLLVCGMTQILNNKIRYFDGATGDYRESMWNGMPWVHQMRMGPDGLVYLVSLTVVQRMDLSTGRTIENFIDGVLEGAGTFVDLLFEPDGNILLLDNFSNNIRRYDGVTGQYMGVFAALAPQSAVKAMDRSPNGNILVVATSTGGNIIHEIDGSTGASLGSLITPGAGGLVAGAGITVHTDGLVYVSNIGNNSVLRYDATTGVYAGQFVAPGSGGLSNPHGLRFGPDGNLYVASRNTDSVKMYDGSTGAPLGDFVAPGTDGMDAPAGLLFVPRVPGDVDGDRSVGINDFLGLLGAWGPCAGACPPSCMADFDADCTVGIADFLILLANWS